jgi:predicted TIM-barrel fold metal-dependent hydrolase
MKIDCHMHVNGRSRSWGWGDNDKIIDAADRLGIDKLCCSIPITSGMPEPKQVRECNDDVLEAMKRYPDRILGYCFVNPGHGKEAIAEIERCVIKRGMMGIKLYNQYKCSDPIVYPVVEKAIELGIPILEHAGYVTDPPQAARQPNISHAADFVKLAAEYPEAMLIEAHIGGGGDWEWSIKTLRHSPGVYLDTSGSVIDEGMIEMAVRELGAERLLFGTDMTMEGGVGKVMGADITEAQREEIFWKNMAAILEKRESP